MFGFERFGGVEGLGLGIQGVALKSEGFKSNSNALYVKFRV